MKEKTLQQFADGINEYLIRHPEHKDLPVVSAADDEGNGYNRIIYDPAYGDEWELRNGDEIEAVCIS